MYILELPPLAVQEQTMWKSFLRAVHLSPLPLRWYGCGPWILQQYETMCEQAVNVVEWYGYEQEGMSRMQV